MDTSEERVIGERTSNASRVPYLRIRVNILLSRSATRMIEEFQSPVTRIGKYMKPSIQNFVYVLNKTK